MPRYRVTTTLDLHRKRRATGFRAKLAPGMGLSYDMLKEITKVGRHMKKDISSITWQRDTRERPDDARAQYEQRWNDGVQRLKPLFDDLKFKKPNIDDGVVFGIIVTYLSPLDRWFIQDYSDANTALLELTKQEIKKVEALRSALSCFGSESGVVQMPEKLRAEMDRWGQYALDNYKTVLSFATKRQRIFDKYVGYITRRGSAIRAKAESRLMDTFVSTGMKPYAASRWVIGLLQAWDHEFAPASRRSILVRCYSKKSRPVTPPSSSM